jgi:hypothetical protein
MSSIGSKRADAHIVFRRPPFVHPVSNSCVIDPKEIDMAKGEQRSNRESKKPKKEKIKVIAAAPSQKAAGWQPTLGTGKKK